MTTSANAENQSRHRPQTTAKHSLNGGDSTIPDQRSNLRSNHSSQPRGNSTFNNHDHGRQINVIGDTTSENTDSGNSFTRNVFNGTVQFGQSFGKIEYLHQ